MGESSMPRLRSATLVIGILALTAGVPGQKTYQEGLKAALAKAGDKPVLIDFHAVW
jgi:thiol:disulfide interchange protein